jgi:hypothetical protein
LCHCPVCHRLWLERPEGEAQFSRREFSALVTLRKRYLAGQLVQ